MVAVACADRREVASVRQAVRAAVSMAGDVTKIIPRGARVVLKPNIFAPYPPPTTANPPP